MSRSSLLASPSPPRGVTLIELLVVITIIAMLAALVLGVAAVAGETSREQHTKHVVERLHTLVMDFYGTYKTRRVRLNPAIEAQIEKSNGTAAEKGRLKAEARLYALRELMVLEIPDRWSDVLLNAVPSNPNGAADALLPMYLDPASVSQNGRTALSQAYLRRYHALVTAQNKPTAEQLTDNQGAECLYMIVTMACGDGEARTLFAENSIGDTDGDGAPEFLDGWNHPINFLRWAPGFESPVQIDANLLGPPDPKNLSATWIKAAANDHDQFDLFRVDPMAFRLVPLIYSGGRDETFGIRLVKPHVTWRGIANMNNLPRPVPPLSPYVLANDPSDGSSDFLGTLNVDGTATDNVHNHLIGQGGKQ